MIHDRLRAAGIDVAALTDHTVAASVFDRDVCAPVPDVVGERNECRALFGMDDGGWQRTKSLAAAADAPARYAALPGFEWSSPYLGHMNVWFAEEWADALETGGLTEDGLARIGVPLALLELQLRRPGDPPAHRTSRHAGRPMVGAPHPLIRLPEGTSRPLASDVTTRRRPVSTC